MKRRFIVVVALVLVLCLLLLVACKDSKKEVQTTTYTMTQEKNLVHDSIVQLANNYYYRHYTDKSIYENIDIGQMAKSLVNELVKILDVMLPHPTYTKSISISEYSVAMKTDSLDMFITNNDLNEDIDVLTDILQFLVGEYKYENNSWIVVSNNADIAVQNYNINYAVTEAQNANSVLKNIIQNIVFDCFNNENITSEYIKDTIDENLRINFSRLDRVEGLVVKSYGMGRVTAVIYTNVQAVNQIDIEKGYINVNKMNVTNTMNNTVLATKKDGAPLLTGEDAKYNSVGILDEYDFDNFNKNFIINITYNKDSGTWQSGLIE